MPHRIPQIALFLGLAAVVILLFSRQLSGRWFASEVVIAGTAVPPLPALDRALMNEGRVLYEQYCAACHGADLEGAVDWKAPLPDGSFPPPPHDDTGHTWHHPDFLLLQIITEGGGPVYGGTMPGFGSQLTEEEMRAVLEYLKSEWGQEAREYQWWLTRTYPTPTPVP